MTKVEFAIGAGQINDCEYLFLRSVREIEELTLELIVTEAKAQPPVPDAAGTEDPIEKMLAGSRPIMPDSTCRLFRLVFDRGTMVSYTVLNECYGKYPEQPEQFTGKLFRLFTWSHLLEFTKSTTYASNDYPGPLRHYQIACLNHVVDVICTGPPEIAVGTVCLTIN